MEFAEMAKNTEAHDSNVHYFDIDDSEAVVSQ